MPEKNVRQSESVLVPNYGAFAIASAALFFVQALLLFALKPSSAWTIQSCFTSGLSLSISDSRDSPGLPHVVPQLNLHVVPGELVLLLLLCAMGLNAALWIVTLIRFRTHTGMLDAGTCFACGHPIPGGDRCIECGILQASSGNVLRRRWLRATGLVAAFFIANTSVLLCLRSLPLECVVESKPGSASFCTPAIQGGRFAYMYTVRGVANGVLWSPYPHQATEWYAVLGVASKTPGDWRWHVVQTRYSGVPNELLPALSQLSSRLGVTLSKDQLEGFDQDATRTMNRLNTFGFWLAWPQPTIRSALILAAVWFATGLVSWLIWLRIFRSSNGVLTPPAKPLSSS